MKLHPTFGLFGLLGIERPFEDKSEILGSAFEEYL